MSRGPKGEIVIGAAVMVGRIATGDPVLWFKTENTVATCG